jgi:predicted transcriptional regulator YheO
MAADDQDAILAALTSVVPGIAATMGAVCEVVLHDFRRPEHSVVAIAGDVTGRTVGGSMSEIGMGVLAEGDEAADRLNYVTRTSGGKLVKSSTMVLRDADGTVFGALCVNLDITAIKQVHDLVGDLAGLEHDAAVPQTTFSEDIDTVVDAVVDAQQLRLGRSWAALGRDERLGLFRALDDKGVFALRRAVPQVAARLGISRASAYNYLADARARPETTPGEISYDHDQQGERPL